MPNTLLQKYAESPYVRSFVQLIPNFGGAIDTILYEKGSKWRQERFDKLLISFDEKLTKLSTDNVQLKTDFENKIDTDDFYTLFVRCAQESTLENDKDKIEAFSNILVNYISITNDDKYEVEIYLNITKQLSHFEMQLLAALLTDEVFFYKSYNGHICDLEKYKQEFTYRGMSIGYGNEETIPKQYFVPEKVLFSYNRLVNNFLITINNSNSHGTINAEWSNGSQHGYTPLAYLDKITYQITEFGKEYCKWIRGST
jgi:hypothetical protein